MRQFRWARVPARLAVAGHATSQCPVLRAAGRRLAAACSSCRKGTTWWRRCVADDVEARFGALSFASGVRRLRGRAAVVVMVVGSRAKCYSWGLAASRAARVCLSLRGMAQVPGRTCLCRRVKRRSGDAEDERGCGGREQQRFSGTRTSRRHCAKDDRRAAARTTRCVSEDNSAANRDVSGRGYVNCRLGYLCACRIARQSYAPAVQLSALRAWHTSTYAPVPLSVRSATTGVWLACISASACHRATRPSAMHFSTLHRKLREACSHNNSHYLSVVAAQVHGN